MLKRMIIIAVAFACGSPFSGCYTKVAYGKLSKPEWKEGHRDQYFHEYDWGKEWDNYYWSPTTRSIFNGASSQKGQASDAGQKRAHRYGEEDGCLSDCITSCILAPLDIINVFIFGDDDDDNSDDENSGSQDKPQRRRGTE